MELTWISNRWYNLQPVTLVILTGKSKGHCPLWMRSLPTLSASFHYWSLLMENINDEIKCSIWNLFMSELNESKILPTGTGSKLEPAIRTQPYFGAVSANGSQSTGSRLGPIQAFFWWLNKAQSISNPFICSGYPSCQNAPLSSVKTLECLQTHSVMS